MLKEELFKKVIECKNTLVSIENKMNKTTDPEAKEKLENEWAEVFGMQQSYITAIENTYKQEKYQNIDKEEIKEKEEVELPKVEEEVEETPVVEESVEDITSEVELPQIEEETPVEGPVEEKEEVSEVEIPQVEENAEVTEIPVEEKTPEVEEQVVTEMPTEENKIVYINETSNPTPGKKISVNENQLKRLHDSKEDGKAKITMLYPKEENTLTPQLEPVEEQSVVELQTPVEESNNEIDPQKQMEDMLNQQRELYNEGKVEEAEALSNDISVLTKKISGSEITA